MTYYRNWNRAPCNAVIPQRMVINCGANWPEYSAGDLIPTIETINIVVKRVVTLTQKVWP